jgi:hypothetical protein|tara:strand:+ start:115 stop:429 length:315 start_codon:yes stop_codon:yes gene_type:complete
MQNYIDKEVIWAKGRTKAEKSKYTTWSGGDSKSYSLLGGLGVSTYTHNNFVGVTAHNSDGRSYGKYLQIPLDNIKDFCDALIEARDFTLQNQKQNQNQPNISNI